MTEAIIEKPFYRVKSNKHLYYCKRYDIHKNIILLKEVKDTDGNYYPYVIISGDFILEAYE